MLSFVTCDVLLVLCDMLIIAAATITRSRGPPSMVLTGRNAASRWTSFVGGRLRGCVCVGGGGGGVEGHLRNSKCCARMECEKQSAGVVLLGGVGWTRLGYD